jgi:hypothetical protein
MLKRYHAWRHMTEKVQCIGICEQFFPREQLRAGTCEACYKENGDARSRKMLRFLEHKPFVLRSKWTQFAAQRGAPLLEMNSLIERWIANGEIEMRHFKGAAGAPSTQYRLKDVAKRAPLDTRQNDD